MKYRLSFIIIGSVIFGILLSIAYINPFNEVITLSELILQLSGSRGTFCLANTLDELLGFTIRLLPCFVFLFYAGTDMYRFFCTASIYVFSRKSKRLNWYLKEILSILAIAFLYEFILLTVSILITICRYQVHIDEAGIVIFLIHLFAYSIWNATIAIVINLVALYLGSDLAFLICVSIQIFGIFLFKLIDLFESNKELSFILINSNFMAHLVLGWHSSHLTFLNDTLHSNYSGLYFINSMIVLIILFMVAIFWGGIIIKKHDFLNSNTEMWVM